MMQSKLQNHMSRWVWMLAALALCGAAVVGLAQWPVVQFELGYAYENGNIHGWTPGFTQNYRQAAGWLTRAAQANHARAQYRLGILLARGWGVPRDDARSVEWFTKSAANGYAPACFHLGWMYHHGDGVPLDKDKASRLLEQAASQGMAAANLALGRFHERGEGVAVDAVQALKWYVLAAHFARSRPELYDNAAFTGRTQTALAKLAAHVDTAQLERARELAGQWLAALVTPGIQRPMSGQQRVDSPSVMAHSERHR